MKMHFLTFVYVVCSTIENLFVQPAPTVISENSFEKLNQVENEDSYNIRLNGDAQREPPWPPEQLGGAKMLLLPKKMELGDKIMVEGIRSHNWQSLSLSLLHADQYNEVCSVNLNVNNNTIYLEPGSQQASLDEIDTSSTGFNFKFEFSNNNSQERLMVQVSSDDNMFADIPINHSLDSIRYLALKGDVQSVTMLSFLFGS